MASIISRMSRSDRFMVRGDLLQSGRKSNFSTVKFPVWHSACVTQIDDGEKKEGSGGGCCRRGTTAARNGKEDEDEVICFKSTCAMQRLRRKKNAVRARLLARSRCPLPLSCLDKSGGE